MNYFEKYVSNTTAGSSNQTYFCDGDGVGRVFYRLFCGGKFQYSFLFSNSIDSTYANGQFSRKNRLCSQWELRHASFCVVKELQDPQLPDAAFLPLTFSGESSKTVMPGEFFCSDAVEIEADAGDYLCIEISFCGKEIPYHREIIIPTFRLEQGKFVPSAEMPVPQMIGCDRKVKKRVTFLGDSVTQGIGTEKNSYTHWCHLVAQNLGTEYAYWNLGIGYGRAEDPSTDGPWMWKAKQSDCVVVCLGVNDTVQYADAPVINGHLAEIVRLLKEAGIKVILQALPPLDLEGYRLDAWVAVNDYIRNTLGPQCDGWFDPGPLLCQKDHPEKTVYGDHPNAQGCQLWAEHLTPILKRVLLAGED